MITVRIDPRIYNPVYYPLLQDETMTQIIFGGSSSGKSVFQAQRVVTDLIDGRNYLITRKVGNTLRTSAFSEAKKVINTWRLEEHFHISTSDMTITCMATGAQALFKGLDDVEKLKSITPANGVITDIWIEEATEVSYDDVKQLQKRLRGPARHPKRIIMTFNPITRTHWIYQNYFAGRWDENKREYRDQDLLILKTTYLDNKYLTAADRRALESETDPYFYDVYTCGNWGILGHLILTNWRAEDLTDRIPLFEKYRNGLDFGFTNDPTAHVRFTIRGKTIYITHGFYDYGMTNSMIADKLRPVIGNELIRCDSAEPKSIAELRSLGINALAASKGKGSVNQGIQYLQQFQIIVHYKLQPVINELNLWQWQKTKDGEVINTPVDKYNHALDALRYGVSDLYRENDAAEAYTPSSAGVYVP